MSVIGFRNVVKRFNGRAVLDGVSFSVEKGEIFCIVGPSGTGKSVALKHMVGLLAPTSGEVEIADGARIGYLFQSGALLAWLPIFDNVALPLRETTRMSDDEIERRTMEALRAVGLESSSDRYPSEVSGGMLKRAGLARAIVCESDVILYDEPTSGLDPVTAATIDSLIVGLNRRMGITSVVVTHDLRSALAMAGRILLLKNGKAVVCATPDEFTKSENPDVRELLAAMEGGRR